MLLLAAGKGLVEFVKLVYLLRFDCFLHDFVLLLLLLLFKFQFDFLLFSVVQYLIVEVFFFETAYDLLVLGIIERFDVVSGLSCMLAQALGDGSPFLLAGILLLKGLHFLLFGGELLLLFLPLTFEFFGERIGDFLLDFDGGFGDDSFLLIFLLLDLCLLVDY